MSKKESAPLPVNTDLPPIFARDGDRLIPSPYARGPWRDDVQHGSVMIGLLARAVEQHPADKAVQVTRMTVDMMRAAPLQPVETRCRARRAGRLVETLEAGIDADGEEFVRATAMRFRVENIDTTSEEGSRDERTERLEIEYSDPRGYPFFARTMQMRPGKGPRGGMMWLRMRVPLVEGEPLSPLVRVALASDFAYGSMMLNRAKNDPTYVPDANFSMINPDTSINLHRPLEGEWVGLEPEMHLGQQGAATVSATIWDDRGRIGYVTQSILLRTGSMTKGVGWEKLRRARRDDG